MSDMDGPDYLRREYWQGKIIDIHTHFFPDKMFRAIWNFFESFDWKITYKGSPGELVETLAGLGVVKHTLLNYAHKPGIAAAMNEWTAEFARATPSAIPFFTVHVDDDRNERMARDLISRGFAGLKLQPLVQDFRLDDERLFPVYEVIEETGAWLIAHAGTAPYPNDYVGARYFREMMKRFPDIKVVVAHMGAYEFDDFFEMLDRHPNMRLDTTMVFTDTHVFDTSFPESKLDDLIRFADRVLFGSDFPNIPYPYEEAIDGLLRLGIDEEFYAGVFRENAVRDFDL